MSNEVAIIILGLMCIYGFIMFVLQMKMIRRKDDQIQDLLNRLMSKNYTEYAVNNVDQDKIDEEMEKLQQDDNDGIKEYIAELKAQGFNKDEIRETLAMDYDEEVVNESII